MKALNIFRPVGVVGLLVCSMAFSTSAAGAPGGVLSPSTKTPRIVFQVTGGLVAADNRLSLYDDGRVVYAVSDVRGARTMQSVVSVREVELLVSLFEAAEFAKMPPYFKADGVVMDGVTYLVTYKLPNGSSWTVQSETAAVEPIGFAMIREQCCLLTRQINEEVVVELKSSGGFTGENRTLIVRACGDWSYRCETAGQPQAAHEAQGVFPPGQLARLFNALTSDDFPGMPVCFAGHGGADVVAYELTATLNGVQRTLCFTQISPIVPESLRLVERSMTRLTNRVEN